MVDLFENWVSIEMVASKSKGTLFRLNSCSTTYFTNFIKLNCLHYLWWVNAILIHEISLKSGRLDKSNSSRISNSNDNEEMILMEVSSTELNPEQLGGEVDELFIKANSYQLLLYLTQLERRIVTSDSVMPSDMRRMLRHIYKQGSFLFSLFLFFLLFFCFFLIKIKVGTKFDNDSQMRAIGGFLILRAINPSLCTPIPYALTTEKISPNATKELMNIGRILQNLANETLPSEKNKFLAPFDDFVQNEIPKIREYYKSLVENEPQNIDSKSILEVPPDVEEDALAAIWNFIYNNKESIQKSDEDGQFKELLEKIDKPIEKTNKK